MNPHAYTEEQLVEQPAIGLFASLGWQTVAAMEENPGAGGSLGRETRGEVVLVNRLRAALHKFNPTLPGIQLAIDELTRDRGAKSLEAANREVYHLIFNRLVVGSSPTWPTNEIPLQKHCPAEVGFSPRQAVTRSRPLAQI